MGMYNEVFKTCPQCNGLAYMQIPQIVLGFGNFNLDNHSTLIELSEEDLLLLKEYVKDRFFDCECGNHFKFNEKTIKEKEKFIKNLFEE